jgi:nitroreductase
MDTFEAIATKLEITEFSDKPVPAEIKRKVLEAARLSPSGVNSQHWRFILIQDKNKLKQLADDSTTGKWVGHANFAVVVLTDPKYNFHQLDAGRVIQNMQLAAWNYYVGSRIYTGMNRELMIKHFGIPENYNIAAVVGFGFPKRKILGKKNRKELEEIAFSDYFGRALIIA